MNDITFFGGMAPDPGETIRLQLELHRQWIGLRAIRPAQPLHFAFDPKDLLDVMSEFVRDHIGLRKLTGSSKTPFPLVEEPQIEVDFFVAWAVEGPRGGVGLPACGWVGIAIHNHLGVAVADVRLRREQSLPG